MRRSDGLESTVVHDFMSLIQESGDDLLMEYLSVSSAATSL